MAAWDKMQIWWWRGEVLGLKFENKGEIEKPKILLTIYANDKKGLQLLDSLIKEIKYRYNLELDLMPFYREFLSDKKIAPVIRRWWGMRPGHHSSLDILRNKHFNNPG